MKILLLAPVHNYDAYYSETALGQPFVSYQGQQGWYEALLELGHSVEVVRYSDSALLPTRFVWSAKKALAQTVPTFAARINKALDRTYRYNPENWIRNRRILKVAESFQPDVVIFSGGTSCVFPSTFKTLKTRFSCKLALLSGVNPRTSATPAELDIAKIVDIVATNDHGYEEEWKKLGASQTVTLPVSAINPKLHRTIKLSEKEIQIYGSDVCFVGSLTEDRQKKLANLIGPKKFEFKIWGDLPGGLKLANELFPYYHGVAHGEKMVRIYNASKIALNFQPVDMSDGGNMRSFEIPGCGVMQMADKISSEWYVEDEEYVCINKNAKQDPNELLQKIHYYLDHESARARIARAGHERTIREHTYKKRFKKLLDMLSQ